MSSYLEIGGFFRHRAAGYRYNKNSTGNEKKLYCGSGAFLTPGSGMVKNWGYGSGMNNPDHISECLETICFDVDPRFGIRDGKNSDPGSGMEKNVDPGCLSRIPEIRKCLRQMCHIGTGSSNTSVADPDLQDPYRTYVFGPLGSGSVSQRYGSGSLDHQAK